MKRSPKGMVMKRLPKGISIVALTLVMAFGLSSVVYASSEYISGELNKSGSLVRYNVVRTHGFNGPIGLNITDMPDGYLRLGLRNMKKPDGPQFTDSIQWDRCEYREWEGILQGTKFAFQGRMRPTDYLFADNVWGGHLTY